MTNHKTFGPRAYTEADADDFKGRDKAVRDILNLIQMAEMTTIYAMSGDGKSSLIHAGLYPRMRDRFWFPIEIRFSDKEYSQPNFFHFDPAIGCSPFESWMTNEIIQEAKRLHLSSYVANDIILPNANGQAEEDAYNLIKQSLWWMLRSSEFSKDDADCLPHQYHPVLVFDQFEEVINYPDKRTWTDDFFRFLQEATSETPPQRLLNLWEEQQEEDAKRHVASLLQAPRQLRFKMLFALRKEYIGALDYWTQQEYYIPALSRNRYCLLPLHPEEAQIVADHRITTSGRKVTLERMNQLIASAKESEGENKGLVSPLILSILLDELDTLSQKDVEGLKPEGILRCFYERQLKQTNLRQGEIRILENALIDNFGRRRPNLSIDDEKLMGLDFADSHKADLEKMDKELHLVRCISIHGKSHIELVHDRLADVVNERRNNKKQKRKRIVGLISYVLAFTLISAISVLLALRRPVVNTWADSYAPLATIEHHGVWTTEDVQKTQGAGKIDEVLWDKGDTITLMYMGYLSKLTVDVENPVFSGFAYCPRLREIKFTNKVKTVKGQSYIGGLGENLTIVIGDSLEKIDFSFRQYLGNDTKFILSPNNPYLKLGYAYDTGETVFGERFLKIMLWEKASKEVLFLQDYQGHYTNADNIVFPEEFRGKEVHAGFYKFKNEEQRTLDEQLTYAGRDFETFTINPADTVIGMYAFMKCKQLKSINLNNISTINTEAFAECSSLKTIDLRKVKRLDGIVFHNCFELSEVLFPYDSIALGATDFDGCRSLKEIRLPQKVEADCRATFRRCINLTSVYLPDTLIANSFYSKDNELPTMFSYCPKLKHFEFSSQSQFNWREDSVLYYKDTPAFLNLCTNPNWCAKDSSYYFKNGLLYKKSGVLVDACAGSWKREGCSPQTELFLHFYHTPYIGCSSPYPFYPNNEDTTVTIPQKTRGTFAIVNPSAVIKELRLPYAEPRTVGIDLTETFAEPSDITLIVPWHRRDAYESDPTFQQYGRIIEESFWTTAWQIVKNDLSELITTSKRINFSKPLTSPLCNWMLCVLLAFVLIISMNTAGKSQSSEKLYGKDTVSFILLIYVFWPPVFFLLFHLFALHLPCNSYEECIMKSCLGGVAATICVTLIYLQFIKSGLLTRSLKQLKKKMLSTYRKYV